MTDPKLAAMSPTELRDQAVHCWGDLSRDAFLDELVRRCTPPAPGPDAAIDAVPGKMGGRPCLRGTRMPVAQLVASLFDCSGKEYADDFDIEPKLVEDCLQEIATAYSRPNATGPTPDVDREDAVCDRLVAWIRNPNRKPAVLAFTAGGLRQVAYAVEDVTRSNSPPAPGPVLATRGVPADMINLRDLVKCQEQLLACFRLGKRPNDKLLDRIVELKQRLFPPAPAAGPTAKE